MQDRQLALVDNREEVFRLLLPVVVLLLPVVVLLLPVEVLLLPVEVLLLRTTRWVTAVITDQSRVSK
jgi:hypothetical protein